MKRFYVILLSAMCGVTILWSAPQSPDTPPKTLLTLKKITVVETNNYFYTDRSKYLYLPKGPKDPDMRKLHDYVSKQVSVKGASDPDIFTVLMEWTCLQWKHDPLHEPPPGTSTLEILQRAAHGERFRCQEYAEVLQNVLTSYGYVSRLLQLRKTDAAYGSPGAGHVAVEAYSNTLGKWIFLDPQWCITARNDKEQLSFYDMFLFKKANHFDSVRFVMSPTVLKRDSIEAFDDYDHIYREFIQQYFGYEGFIANRFGGLVFLFLPLEAKEQYFTFQGVPVSHRVFTDKQSNLYFQTNSTVVLFDYDKEVNWNEIFARYDIKSTDDYVNNMPKFAAKPDFTLHFDNNCIWFDHYEIKVDNGEWKRLKGDKFTWDLAEGMNEFRVRAVNVAGVKGRESYTKIRYGSDMISGQ